MTPLTTTKSRQKPSWRAFRVSGLTGCPLILPHSWSLVGSATGLSCQELLLLLSPSHLGLVLGEGLLKCLGSSVSASLSVAFMCRWGTGRTRSSALPHLPWPGASEAFAPVVQPEWVGRGSLTSMPLWGQGACPGTGALGSGGGCFPLTERQDVHAFLLENLTNGGILELLVRYLKSMGHRFLLRWPPGLAEVVLSIYHSWRRHSASLPNPLLRDCSSQHIKVGWARGLHSGRSWTCT